MNRTGACFDISFGGLCGAFISLSIAFAAPRQGGCAERQQQNEQGGEQRHDVDSRDDVIAICRQTDPVPSRCVAVRRGAPQIRDPIPDPSDGSSGCLAERRYELFRCPDIGELDGVKRPGRRHENPFTVAYPVQARQRNR